VGRKEGWAAVLLGALQTEEVRRAGAKEEERRWAALGWNGRREGEKRGLVFLFFQILFQTFKSLNSFKTISTFKLFSKIFKSI
jgi:hypothetical protein